MPNTPRSKTSKINKCREELLSEMKAYALHANDWEIEAEGDYDDIEESFNSILEKYISEEK